MKVLEVFHEVGTQTSVPCIGGEQADVVEVGCGTTFEVDAYEGFGVGARRIQLLGVLLPVVAADADTLASHHFVVATDEFNANLCALAATYTCVDREVVVESFLESDAEIAVILYSCLLLAMAVVLECHVVGILVEGGPFAVEGNISEDVPSLQSAADALSARCEMERCFKGTVLDEFGIESSVGSEVDVFEEDAIHGGLDGSARLGVEQQLALSVGSSYGGDSQSEG